MSVLLELFYRGIATQQRAAEARCIDALTSIVTMAKGPVGRRGPFTGHDLVLSVFEEFGGYENMPTWLRHYGIDIGTHVTDGTPVQLQLI